MRGGVRIGPPGIWWHNPDLVQKLTLTPDQVKRMDDILQQSRLQLIDLRANVEKQELLMEPMLAANPPDTNKVLAQIDHTAQARAELEKANAKMLLGIRNVLTPDQWTKLQTEEQNNRRMRMKRGDGPGVPGMTGPPPPAGGPGAPGGGDGL
jgi:Spy/CpxP family protein refolding chaperone